MKAWLMKSGTWGIVCGKEKRPDEDKHPHEAAAWDKLCYKAAGEIFLCVSKKQRVHFRGDEEDPIKMWKKLEAAHLQKKPGARYNAYDALFSINKKDDETLVDMGVRIEQAMADIQNLRPSKFTVEELDEELECMALIRALPEDYAHLASALLLQSKLDRTMILQAFQSEEQNRQRRTEVVNRAKGPPNRFRRGYQGGNNGNQGNGNNSGSNGNNGKPSTTPYWITCHNCGQKGHFKWECPSPLLTNGGNANKAQESKIENVTENAGNASAFSHDACSTSSNNDKWNTDTGATSHMTPHERWIRNYTPYRVPIRLADNRIIYSKGVGSVVFRPVINGKQSRDVEFTRVLHVPALQNNLLAVLYLTKHKEFDVHISADTMSFIRNKTVMFTAHITNENVGYLDGETLDRTESVHQTSTLPLDLALWHRRLCHHNYNDVKRLLKEDLAVGMTLDSKAKPDPICEPCLAGKMNANPFPSSETRATELLELIHTDVHEVGARSRAGHYYWVTFIDDKSRFKAVMPIKRKSDTFAAFKIFKAYAEKQTGRKIKAIRDDKAGEYMSKEFIRYTEEQGIVRQHTVRNRPQQNGVAERTNRTLAERMTAMLNESGLSPTWWKECLAALVHVLNRCPTSAVVEGTPYEVWHKRKPNVGHLRVWGCVAYVHIQKDKRSKLGSHMEKCIFVGYPDGYKGWMFYNPVTKRVIICERADFDERYNWNNRLFSTPSTTPKPPTNNTTTADNEHYVPLHSPDDNDTSDDTLPRIEEIPPDMPAPAPEIDDLNPHVENDPDPNGNNDDGNDNNGTPSSSSSSSEDEAPINLPIAFRREPRNRKPPGEWWKVPRQPTPAIASSDEEDEGEDNNDGNDSEQANMLSVVEPSSYNEAIKTPEARQWKEAALEEMNAHLENQTWTIMELPPGQKAIGSKWVFKVKQKADGTIERYKARVVAKGYNQRPGYDYQEIFAPTMRLGTI